MNTYLKHEVKKARRWNWKYSDIKHMADHYRQVLALGLHDIDPYPYHESVLDVGDNEKLIAYITEHWKCEAALLASMGWNNIRIVVSHMDDFYRYNLHDEIDSWEVEIAPYSNGQETGLPHWQVYHDGYAYAVKATMFSHLITETSKSARASQMKYWGENYTLQYIALICGDVECLSWDVQLKYKNCVLAKGIYRSGPQPDAHHMQPFIGEAWLLDPCDFMDTALNDVFWAWEDNITKHLRENNISGAQIFMETPEVYWPHIGEE